MYYLTNLAARMFPLQLPAELFAEARCAKVEAICAAGAQAGQFRSMEISFDTPGSSMVTP